MITANTHFAEKLDSLEAFLKEHSFKQHPQKLHDSVEHIMRMKSKRIRPLLAMYAAEAFSGEAKNGLGAAAAVEVFHNFTLVHDDIIDNADIRRGNPAVHVVYGVNQAIVTGDAMIPYAYNFLLHCPEDALRSVLTIFNKAAKEVMEGQQLDIDFEDQNHVEEEEYMVMIRDKTSVLLGASLQMGAACGGASEEDQKLIYSFGVNLGLAFQIMDDLLDTYGEGDKVGKKIGGDILNNKKTFLMITALNDADESRKKDIIALFDEDNDDVKINAMIEHFNALGVEQKTRDKMETLYQQALSDLDDLSIPNEQKLGLRDLANAVYNRDF